MFSKVDWTNRLWALSVAIPPVFALGLGGSAVAEPFSGNDVHHACETQDAGAAQGFCVGYVLGAVEGMKWGALVGIVAMSAKQRATDELDIMSSTALGFCIPPQVENGQILDIVASYMDAVPAQRHESARTLIMEALSLAFPCP